MGVDLAPIVPRRVVKLEHLRGVRLAVDANNALYQFLALIRTADGRPLADSKGRVTSHLLGLSMRATRLIADYGMRLVFVFDGPPHPLKRRELERRREQRERAMREWLEALRAGDYAKAFSKAVASGVLTREMVEEAKRLLDCLGIPWVQAPSDAEAQGAYMASRGDVDAVATNDYDALLYGAERVVRYLTISGFDYLPSKGVLKPLVPEVIELSEVLSKLGITREQLVDVAILVGTDFNEGVRGIGPKRALKLIKLYGSLDRLPRRLREGLGNYEEVRRIFLEPRVTDAYELEMRPVDEEGLYKLLCDEHDFSEERVALLVERMRRVRRELRQRSLAEWL